MTLSSEGAIPGALSIETTLSWGKLPGTMNLAATVVMRSPAGDENVAGVDAAELFLLQHLLQARSLIFLSKILVL